MSFHQEQDYFLDLVPMKKLIPDWYKSIASINKNELDFDSQGKKGIKYCMPFLDSLTTGYAMLLPCDVVVKKTDDENYIFTWGDGSVRIIEERNSSPILTIPNPQGYAKNHFVWVTPISIQLPKGYSAIFTHPFNRYDLPFISYTGVIDLDDAIPGGLIPFFLKENFEGLIPAGTPIFQIIPFKREDWEINKDISVLDKSLINRKKSLTALSSYYKNNLWKRKKYS